MNQDACMYDIELRYIPEQPGLAGIFPAGFSMDTAAECMEQGPIRPPSEAYSLFLRLARGCPWNKCAFCGTYRGIRYSPRTTEEIKADIDGAFEWASRIRAASQENGRAGAIDERAIAAVAGNAPVSSSRWNVASWLSRGAEHVFLQDADALALPAKAVREVLAHLKDRFPTVARVTTYCRSRTAARKNADDFRMLADSGLSRVHVGLESGCAEVLEAVRKGVSAEDHVKAGLNIKEAGISLSEYVMPGLGGTRLSSPHATETARVLNLINPDFIRLRTLAVTPDHDLHAAVAGGGFNPPGDDAIVREIRLLIENLTEVESTVVSDHILNLLEEVEGRLPGDKGRILAVIDAYLSMDEDSRIRFRLGRRTGIIRVPADLSDPRSAARVDSARRMLGVQSSQDMDLLCREIMRSYI